MRNSILTKRTISFAVWLVSYFSCLLYAEEDQDSIQRGLIYFSPQVTVSEKSLPCQGFRLSDNSILTSPACYVKVLSLLDQQVEALNKEGHVIGKIVRRTENRCDSESLSSSFSIEQSSGDLPYKNFSFFTAYIVPVRKA